MTNFIQLIYNFIIDLFVNISNTIGNSTVNSELYNAWLNKQIISGDLINIGITWRELLLYASTWFLVIFFIIFVFKLIFKVIGLICLR